MPTVNTNSASTFALNKMNQTEREMLTAMERLSSGNVLIMQEMMLRVLL